MLELEERLHHKNEKYDSSDLNWDTTQGVEY
jgi:hypothetical protein